MYSSKIKQWGMFKNNGDAEKAPSVGGEGISKRKRYDVKAAEKVFHALLDHAIPTNPASVHPPDIFKHQELVLFSVYDYILEAFNRGGYQPDQLLSPVDQTSITWQRISDKAYEFGVMFQKSSDKQAAEAYNSIIRQVEPLATSAHPYMMIKFWRVCYYLHRLGKKIRDYWHLYGFIDWFFRLAEAENPSNRSIVQLLGALRRMVQEEDKHTLWYTLRIGYLRSIHCLQAVIGSNNHPTVLSMWANYAKHWSKQRGELAVMIRQYEESLGAARSQSPPSLEHEIFILHGYAYFAFYVAQDSSLSLRLSSELLERTSLFVERVAVSEWRLEIQAFSMASKLTALNFKRSSPDSAVAYMVRAIMILERGEKECRTRALGLADELRSWYHEWGNVVEVEKMARRIADMKTSLG
jgi:hypothetical protein